MECSKLDPSVLWAERDTVADKSSDILCTILLILIENVVDLLRRSIN